jgi:LPXTG-motif cell wall-anchored protein
MKNNNLYIGLGVLAVAGIGFYMWKKKQGEEYSKEETKAETKSNARGVTSPAKSNDVIVMCVPPRTLAGGGFNPYKCVGKGLADEEPIYKY